jgi:hypothetical protein
VLWLHGIGTNASLQRMAGRARRCRRNDARKPLGDPTHDEFASEIGKAMFSRARFERISQGSDLPEVIKAR